MINLQQLLGSKFFSKRGYALSMILSAAATLPATAQTHVVGGNGRPVNEVQAPPAHQNLFVPAGTSIQQSYQSTFHALDAGQFLTVQAGIRGEVGAPGIIAGGVIFTPIGDFSSVRFDKSGFVTNGGTIGDDTVSDPDSDQSLIRFDSGFGTVLNLSTGELKGGISTNGINNFDPIIQFSEDGGIVTNKGLSLVPFIALDGTIGTATSEGFVQNGHVFVTVVNLAAGKNVTVLNEGIAATTIGVDLDYAGASSGNLVFDNSGTGSFFGRTLIIASNSIDGTVKLITSNNRNAFQAAGADARASSTITLSGGAGASGGTGGASGGSARGIYMPDSTSVLTVDYTSRGVFTILSGDGGDATLVPSQRNNGDATDATAGPGGDAIGFDLSRAVADSASVINLTGNLGGSLTVTGGDGGDSLSEGIGFGGFGGTAILGRVSGLESDVVFNLTGEFQTIVTGGAGGTTSGGYGLPVTPLVPPPTRIVEIALGGDGGRAVGITTELELLDPDDLVIKHINPITNQRTTASSDIKFNILNNAGLTITGGAGGADIAEDYGGAGNGGAAYGIYLGDSAGDLTFNHTSTRNVQVTGGVGGDANFGNEEAQGGEGGDAKFITATGGFRGAAKIDHTGSGAVLIAAGVGGASNGTRGPGGARPFGGGSAGYGGFATGIDFNAAHSSSTVDIVLDGGIFSVLGGAGGATSSDRGLVDGSGDRLTNALAGNGSIAVGIDLASSAGVNTINNQGIFLVVGGRGGNASGDATVTGQSGDGGMGTGIDLNGATGTNTIVNGAIGNQINSQINGHGGQAGGHLANGFNNSGVGADGVGINLSLGAAAGVTSVTNYGVIEGLGGDGAITGVGGDGFAIKADSASPVTITNHFKLVSHGGSFDEINLLADGGDAVGIKADAAGAAGVITFTQSSAGSFTVRGGWAATGITPGNASGILTGAAADIITIEGAMTVYGGVDDFDVTKGTALGISTLGGNDIVSLKDLTLDVRGAGASIAVDLGAGNDTLSLDNTTFQSGGVGTLIITGGAGDEDTLDVTGTTGTLVAPNIFGTTVTAFEQFTKSGTGAISLSNDISFTALDNTKFAVNVTGGTLLIADTKTFTASTGKFEVQTGGTISGKGTYDVSAAEIGMVINAGGTFSFGAAAGDTVNVTATAKLVEFKANSILAVNLKGNGTTSKLNLTAGTLEFDGATVLSVTHEDFIANGTVFVIANTPGAITNIGNLSRLSGLFDYTPADNGGNLEITVNRQTAAQVQTTLEGATVLNRSLTPVEVGFTKDIVAAVANGSIGNNSTALGAYLSDVEAKTATELATHIIKTVDQNQVAVNSIVSNTVSAGQTFSAGVDQRIGEVAAAQKSVNDRVYSNFNSPNGPQGPNDVANLGGGWGIWGEALAGTAEQDATDGKAGYEVDTYGVAFGIDYQYDANIAVGVTGGFTTSDTDSSTGLTTTTTDTLTIGAYGLYTKDSWNLRAAGSIGYGSIDSEQTVGINTTTSSTESVNLSLSLSGGYEIAIDDYWSIEPNARLAMVSITVDEYNAGIQSFGETTNDSFAGTVGANINYQSDEGMIVTTSVGWKHEFGDNDRTTTVKTGGGSFYEVSGIKPGEDNLLLGLGVTFQHENDTEFKVGYNAMLGDGFLGQSIYVGFKKGF